MKVTTEPRSSFGWEGQNLEYVVKAEGCSELAVPKEGTDGLNVRILDQKRVGDGVEARVAVEVAKPVFF